MIIEIILEIFVIAYYLFSVFLYAAIVRDKKYTILQMLGIVIETIILSPFAVPIILGIKLGEWIKNN